MFDKMTLKNLSYFWNATETYNSNYRKFLSVSLSHINKHKHLISEECPDSDGASEEGKLFCVHLVVLRLYLLDQVDFYGESNTLRKSTKDMKITHI